MSATAPEPDEGLRLERLGALLGYPGADFSEVLDTCRLALADGPAEALAEIERFTDAVTGRATSELQELYTRTFDLNPVCALDVGWHLYGESYDRGRFLVRMRVLLYRLGLEESGELPDHLISVLPALARLDPIEREEIGRPYVVPAVARMVAGFDGKDNPYAHLLRAVDRTLHDLVGEPEGEPASPSRTVPHHRKTRSRR